MTLHEATSTSHGTAFRVRERLYKRRVPPPGYADVVDVRAVESNTAANRARIRCVAQVVVPNGGASHWLRDELKVFYFDGLEGRSVAVRCRVMDCPGHTTCARAHTTHTHTRTHTDVSTYNSGVVLIPNALNVPGQRHYIHRALSQYARAPNVSNLDAHWQVPRGRGENDMDDDSSLWELWLAERRLARAEQVSSSSRILVQPRDIERVMMADSNDNGDDYAHASATTLPGITPLKHDQPLPPSALMRRLRWTTLGHRYDWHTKQYVELDKAVGMPDDLSILACTLVHAAGPHLSCRVRAVGAGRDMEGEDGEEYRRRRKAAGKTLRHVLRVDDDNVDYDMNDAARDRPEQQEHTLGYTKRYCPQAGIVNFYQIRDTLTAHVDRSELNMEAPLVSLR